MFSDSWINGTSVNTVERAAARDSSPPSTVENCSPELFIRNQKFNALGIKTDVASVDDKSDGKSETQS